MILKQAVNSIAKGAVLSIAVDAAIANGAQLPGGRGRQPAGPNGAFMILDHLRTNVLTCKLRVLGELSVLPTHKPFRGADPKSAVVRGEQAENAAGREMLTRWRLPGDSPDAVEAHQAELRTQPKIPVGRLGNGEDGTFHKAVAHLP